MHIHRYIWMYMIMVFELGSDSDVVVRVLV